jgi:hypothetical protein
LKFLQYFVFTYDTHAPQGIDPVRPFPVDRPYMAPLVDLWLDNPRIAVCKSRQMMVTWLGCALALWDAMFHRGKLILLQSQDFGFAVGSRDTGKGLLGRCQCIIDNMPGRKQLIPPWRDLTESITFKHGSEIIPIAHGSDKTRGDTVSGWLSDEIGFQEKFEQAFTATTACLRDNQHPPRGPRLGGPWAFLLSTATMQDGGYLRRIVRGEDDPS